jgi:hypothetical protein
MKANLMRKQLSLLQVDATLIIQPRMYRTRVRLSGEPNFEGSGSNCRKFILEFQSIFETTHLGGLSLPVPLEVLEGMLNYWIG